MNSKESNSPVTVREYVSIGEAAEVLNVSIDTVRRWEKAGKLQAKRLDGKNRYFSIDDLHAYNARQMLSTTEVAARLGVSPSTVRRLEDHGALMPAKRASNGRRMYDQGAVDAYQASTESTQLTEFINDNIASEQTREGKELLEPTMAFAQVADTSSVTASSSKTPKSSKPPRSTSGLAGPFEFMQKVIIYGISAGIVAVSLFAILLLTVPSAVGGFLWDDTGEPRGAVARAFEPFANRALRVVDVINPSVRDKVHPGGAMDRINVVTRDKEGNITTDYIYSPPSSSYLKIPDQGIVTNLNSEFVQGYKPGTEDGDLAVLPLTGDYIKDGSIKGVDIADGAIQLSHLSNGLVNMLNSSGSSTSVPLVETGDIEGVIAGLGLSGGASSGLATLNVQTGTSTNIVGGNVEVKIAGSGSSATSSSVSGLELSTQGLRLLGGCGSGEILKWNGSSWQCDNDVGTVGSVAVQSSDGSVVVNGVANLQFGPASSSSTEFNVSNIGGGQVRVQLGTNVLQTSNFATALDPTYVNATESPVGGDVSGSFSTGLTINANAVTLGADTTGNYLATLSANPGLAVSGSGSEAAAITISLDTTTTGTTGTTGSNSGLEVGADGLRLLGGCSNDEILKWNGTAWACAADESGGSGLNTVVIKEDNTTVTSSATAINFIGADFNVTDSVTQANIAIDYTNSGITRRSAAEVISGNWTFNDSSFSLQDNADSTKKAAFELGGIGTGVTRTFDLPNVNGTLISTGNLSSITSVGTLTSGVWQGSTIGVQYGGTGAASFTTNGVVYGNGSSALQATTAGTSGQVLIASVAGVPTFTTISGDAAVAASGTLTLSSTGVTANTYGSSTQVPVFTVDAKGRITGVTNTAIAGLPPSGAAGGDLSGTYPSPAVARINGNALGDTTPDAGNLLVGSGASWISRAIAGDLTIAANGTTTIGNDAVTLGVDTTGAYVSTVSVGTGLTVSGVGAESATATINLDVATTGTTGTNSSNSGLEIGSDGLRLIGGCGNGEVLKWNGSAWACAADANAGSLTAQEGDTTVSSAITVLDFLGSDFDLTETPAGEANITIDYANSGIARRGSNETITGGWSFSSGITSSLFTNTGALTLSTTGVGSDITIDSADQIILAGFNCTTFDNGGVLTTDASGNIVCGNDDGGAAGTITGSGTTNRIPLYTGASSLGDSWLLQNVSTLQLDTGRNLELISGDLTVTNGDISVSGTINGATISGGSLSGTAVNGLSVSAGTVSAGVWNGTALTDAYVSDTLTASSFVGSGSTTNAVDLATGEVAGVLSDANISDTLTIGASSTVADGALSASVTLLGGSIQDGEVDDDLTISAFGSVADGALSTNVTLAGNSFNGISQLVQTTAGGLLPALDGSLVTNVNAATLGGQAGSYYLDLSNATGTLALARIADASITNAKLANSSLTVTAGTGLSGGGLTSLGGTATLNLANTTVTANSYGSASSVATFTVDAQGRLTAAGTSAIAIDASQVTTGSFTLGTQTTGDYVQGLGTLTGLSTTGNTGEGSTPTLAVLYGSTANTAVQGNTSITVGAGSNLSGGGSITLGAGGTVTLNTVANPSFGTSVTSPLFTNAGALTLSTTGVGNDLTLNSADQIILTGFDCTSFDNGGVLTVNASGVLTCDNDDGGAAGTITGSGSTNRIPLYTGANSLGSSWLLQNVSTLQLDSGRNLELVSGDLTLTSGNLSASGTINGAIISGGTLSGGSLSSTAVNGLSVAAGTISSGVWNGTALTDAYISDVITIGATGSVADGALSANVTKLGSAIDLATSEVAGRLLATSLQDAGTNLGAADVNIDLSNTNAGGYVTNLMVDGTVTAATFSGNLTGNVTGDITGNVTGNASTATQLAANPTDCAANQFANAIAANGNLTCAALTDADIPNALTIDAFGSVADGALSTNVTLAGNNFNGISQLVQTTAGGLLPALDGSLVTNVNAATLGGQTGSYYLDLGNATGALAIARITDGTITNAKLANSSITITAGTGLSNGGGVSLGGSTTLNLADTAVTIGSYGSASSVATFTVDQQGRLTAAGSTAIAIDASQVTTGSFTLGTQTTGDYVQGLGTLTGLSTTGNTGEGSTPTLAVLYGSTANTAVQGNTAITCAAGTGNLTGGGNTITLGGGGTCSGISTNNAVSFSTSVTTPLVQNAGLTIASTGANSLLFQTNGNTRLTIASDGSATFAGSLTVSSGGIAVTGNSTITGTLSGLTGLTVASGGASISGGFNNNSGGITNAGSIAGATTISASGNINTTGSYQRNGTSGLNSLDCAANEFVGNATVLGGIVTAGACEADDTGISDQNLKTNIAAKSVDLSDIANLNIVDYNYRCLDVPLLSLDLTCDDRTGVIAQEIQALFPELVVNHHNGYLAVREKSLMFYGLQATAQMADMLDGDGNVQFTSVNTQDLTVTSGAVISGGIDNNSGGITEAGSISGISGLSSSGSFTLGLNNTLSDATLTLDNSSLTGVANLNLADGALRTNGTTRITNAGSLVNIAGITVTSGGADITGGINNNGDGITNAGGVTGVTSLGSSGDVTFDLNALLSNTGLTITNSDLTGVANLNLADGALQTGGTTRLTNGGALQNITTIGASGNIETSGVYRQGGVSGITVNCSSNNFLGSINVRGGIITSGSCENDDSGLSDARLKENVVTLDSTLDALKEINVVNFNFRCDEYPEMGLSCDRQTGVIAQELAAVFPELVEQGDDGYYRVNYDALSMYNLKAVSELAQFINSEGNAQLKTLEVDQILTSGVGQQYPAGDSTLMPGDVVFVDSNGNLQRSTSTYQKGLVGVVSSGTGLVIGDQSPDAVTVAAAGKISVRVSTQNGAIEPGDYLTSSSTPGVAMKATGSGPTIGVATSAFSGAGEGRVMVAVSNASVAAGLGSDIEELQQQVAALQNQVQTLSASTSTGLADSNGNTVDIEQLTVGSLHVTLDMFSEGALVVSGTAEFRGTALFDQLVTFGDSVLFNGQVQFNDNVSFSNNTGGYAKILPGQQSVHVSFAKPHLNPPVISLTLGGGKFASYSYTNVTSEGFDIVIQQPATEMLEFSWITLGINNPSTFAQ